MKLIINAGFFATAVKTIASDVAYTSVATAKMAREAAGAGVVAGAAGSCIAADYIAAKSTEAAGKLNDFTTRLAMDVMKRQAARNNKLAR